MGELHRRDVLKTAGAGTGLAAGLGGTTAQRRAGPSTAGDSSTPDAEDRTIVKLFEATAEEGYIVIDGDGPDDDPIEFGGDDIEGDVVIDGLVYDDNTWESIRVDFPSIDPEEIVGDEFDTDGVIDIHVDPIEGQYDPENDVMTADPSRLQSTSMSTSRDW